MKSSNLCTFHPTVLRAVFGYWGEQQDPKRSLMHITFFLAVRRKSFDSSIQLIDVSNKLESVMLINSMEEEYGTVGRPQTGRIGQRLVGCSHWLCHAKLIEQ